MQDLVITEAGQELIAKMIAGTSTVTFTRIRTTDHDYSGIDLKGLTSLEDVKQESLISSIERTNSTMVEIIAAVNNSELIDGYYIRAVGLYAKDEDMDEVLYGVSIEADNPDYLPGFNGHTVSGVTYRINTKVDVSSQVTLEINPAAVATVVQFEDVKDKIDNHIDGIVYSEDGAHGIRYSDRVLQVRGTDGEWTSINGGITFGISDNGCLTATYDDGSDDEDKEE